MWLCSDEHVHENEDVHEYEDEYEYEGWTGAPPLSSKQGGHTGSA
jgi:hypothetical protein